MKIKNGFLLILSFFIAFSLWFYVFNLETQSLSLKIPINLNLPKKYAVLNPYPKRVTVKFNGSRIFLSQLSKRSLTFLLRVDENKIKNKRVFEFDLSTQVLDLPLGVRVETIEIEKISITIDKKIEKVVKLVARFKSDLAPDLMLLSHKIKPNKIRISGPQKKLKRMREWSTEPVSLSDLKGEGQIKIPIIEFPEGFTLVRSKEIILSYSIRPKKANKEITGVKIRFLSSKKNFFSKVKAATIDVLALSHEHLNSLKAQIEVIGNIPEGKEGNVRVKLEANLPTSMHLLRIRPEYINVFVPKS